MGRGSRRNYTEWLGTSRSLPTKCTEWRWPDIACCILNQFLNPRNGEFHPIPTPLDIGTLNSPGTRLPLSGCAVQPFGDFWMTHASRVQIVASEVGSPCLKQAGYTELPHSGPPKPWKSSVEFLNLFGQSGGRGCTLLQISETLSFSFELRYSSPGVFPFPEGKQIVLGQAR